MCTDTSAPPVEPLHGGRLLMARTLFPAAPEPFLDLSTGINPHPYRPSPLPETAWTRLPEPEQEATLCRLAAAAYGASDPGLVVAAPGSQILISLLPGLLACHRAVVLAPTYSGHAAAWRIAGADVVEVGDMTALAACADPGVALVLCNPNNPDGRRLALPELSMLARGCAERGGWLVVDEAFADLEPDVPQAARLLPSPGLVVLRSFGKTYGLAGLRLGFLAASSDLARAMQARLGPWPVAGPAIAIGIEALADPGWLAHTAPVLAAEATRLDRLLRLRGLQVVGGTRLFRLARVAKAEALYARLGHAGILVRRFEEQENRLRFGLPPDEPAWGRLAAALE